ncbi:MAG: hypothetical protein AAF211_21595 [Myxococcota bacterium]
MDPKLVAIQDPCHAAWDEMSGTAQVRHCAQCRLDVHDLSAMTEGEAEALLADDVSRCIRYTVGVDGRIEHRPVRSGLARRVATALTGLGLVVGSPAMASTQLSDETVSALTQHVREWVDWLFGEPVDTSLPRPEERVERSSETELPPPIERPVRTMGIPAPRRARCQEVAIVREGKKRMVLVDQHGVPCR